LHKKSKIADTVSIGEKSDFFVVDIKKSYQKQYVFGSSLQKEGICIKQTPLLF
jgi:hypothetical protein